jgi:hypothetical protein
LLIVVLAFHALVDCNGLEDIACGIVVDDEGSLMKVHRKQSNPLEAFYVSQHPTSSSKNPSNRGLLAQLCNTSGIQKA